MEYTLSNSIEDVSDEENLEIDLADLPEKKVGGERVVSKCRHRFKGFYQSQKTIIVDSESSMDHPEWDNDSDFDKLEANSSSNNWMDNDDDSSPEGSNSVRKNIPKIVEDLVPHKNSTECDDSLGDDDATTESSQVRISKSDRSKIMKDHDDQGNYAEIKPSGSMVNICQGIVENMQLNHLAAENNTSDEDISELASEHPSPMPRKQRLRISLRNLSDSEDDCHSKSTEASSIFVGTKPKTSKSKKNETVIDQEPAEDSPETDESDLEVTDMDYYKIRHQNDTVPYIPSTSSSSINIGREQANPEPESGCDTEESDIEVTAMDYYKIRHAQDQQQAKAVEFSLSWSPTKVRKELPMDLPQASPFRKNSISKNIRSFNAVNVPKYQSRDIPNGFNYNEDEDTDDEEVPCKSDDFMSMEEFLTAHTTNFDLGKGKGESKVQIRQDSILQQSDDDFEIEDEDENTESLRESLISTDNEMDYDVSEATDISEVQTSYAENHMSNNGGGKIELMEHDDLEGTIAVFSPKQSISYDNIGKFSFKPELREITIDDMDLDLSEVVSEDIPTHSDTDEENLDDTDEEDISGIDQISTFIRYPEIDLPKAHRKILRISTSIDGDLCSTEKELPDNHKKNSKKNKEKVPDTDDEIMMLENFVISPQVEEKPTKFPNYYNHSGQSKVIKKEKNKMCRRKKGANKKHVQYDDNEPVTEEI